MLHRGESTSRLALGTALCAAWCTLFAGQDTQTDSPPPSGAAAVVLDHHSCVPADLSFAPGSILLEVVNRTGYDTLTYHIRRTDPNSDTNTNILDFTLRGRLARAHHILQFQAGSYKLTVDQGARWQCEIAVREQ